ncbi:hypothetical protein AK88_01349 [Plasmodium fragile]|uniref:Uncharacterized protein n=1 Tax=Plasmodium fragile TaxID=5857 RepID=A0A0D9QTN1_PLAFR|nr:uncharacterized protein AK88_01349 [Plasmodium fragile]KJP89056.1 hypothetical protein AK88_01349 [Plasmodium fragile]
MNTNHQNDPPPQLYTLTISDAINRYSLMGTRDYHSGSFELDRHVSEEKDVCSYSDWTIFQDDTSDEEGELQTYTSILLGGTNKPIRRRATEGQYDPCGWRGKIKDSPKERPMHVLLNKHAEQEADWTKHILNILLTAEEENKSKDFRDIMKTIEHEEIKDLVLYHSKVVLSEIKNIYRVLGGLVTGSGWVGCKGHFDVSPREEKQLHRLRRNRGGKTNLRVKKCDLLNRYYRRLCRIYEEENSLLRRLCMDSPVGQASEVQAPTKGNDSITTQNRLLKCGITYQAKVGRNFPVEIKSKWIRGALKRASKNRLNLKGDTRIFRFVPHVDMAKKQLDEESLADERSGPNGQETQKSQAGAPMMSTSTCYINAEESEVKSCNEMAASHFTNDNNCNGDTTMDVDLKGEEVECTKRITQEETSIRQNDALVGEETSATNVNASGGGDTGADVMVNEQSEQTGEVPVEEHNKKGLNDGYEKRDNNLMVANSKLEQMHKSHVVESSMDKKTKSKKKKKVAERREKEGNKKKKKILNVHQTNVVTEKEEEKTGDQPLADILDKDTEKMNEGGVFCQEVYHDCTH